MTDFGWPLPPAGTVDKKKCDELICLAKSQWTVFLGIGHKNEWVVLNMTTNEIVFRCKQKRIIDLDRTAIVRVADGSCALRHVYDKHFLLDAENELGACDVSLDFPEAYIHTAPNVCPENGVNMTTIPGGHVLCTVLSGRYKEPNHQRLAGHVTVYSVRSGRAEIVGCIRIQTQTEMPYYPRHFSLGKILIKPLPSSPCPEIWRIGMSLELEGPLVEDVASINTCAKKSSADYRLSKNGHLAFTCCNTTNIVKRGERKIWQSFPSHLSFGWLDQSHLVLRRLTGFSKSDTEGSKYKVINVETGKEKTISDEFRMMPDSFASFAIVGNNIVEVWRINDFLYSHDESKGPAYVLKHPPEIKIDYFNGVTASHDGLNMVTFASDDIFRFWRKDKLIGEHHFPIKRLAYDDEINSVSILDPEMEWVEATGQWLIYSLQGESTFLGLDIISIILTCLV